MLDANVRPWHTEAVARGPWCDIGVVKYASGGEQDNVPRTHGCRALDRFDLQGASHTAGTSVPRDVGKCILAGIIVEGLCAEVSLDDDTG